MLGSLPILLGAWKSAGRMGARSWLYVAAMVAAMLGVFVSASRSHAAMLIGLVVVATFLPGMGNAIRFGWLILLVGVGVLVSSQERLQRFMSLQDAEYVQARIEGSVNLGLIEVLLRYPFGNGLGGGGTSMPSFLGDRVRHEIVLESEYARFAMELTSIGLAMWLAFIVWVLTRWVTDRPDDPWLVSRRLSRFYLAALFASGFIGLGLLSAIPQTAMMLLLSGWTSTRQPVPRKQPVQETYVESEPPPPPIERVRA
jgi:hypothetical protein